LRNLIQIFLKYNNFFFFLFLELICGLIIVQNNRLHRTSFLNSSNYIVGNIYSSFKAVTDYFHLKQVNDSLLAENALLHLQLRSSYYNESGEVKLIKAPTLLTDKARVISGLYIYVPAKVVNNSVHRMHNYITLNKGREDGIESMMGVIGPNGVVGIVKDVSDHFCSVISLLHINVSVSASLRKSNYIGISTWEGSDPRTAKLKDISKHIDLSVGDTVETSGYSNIFPPNVMIGTISHFKLQEGNNFYDIDFRLSTRFEYLDYVYVVNDLMKEEREKLELTIKN